MQGMKETAGIDILVTSRNGDGKIIKSIRITTTLLKRNKVEPVEPIQMNIYQSNMYRKDLHLLHFDNEPRVQER